MQFMHKICINCIFTAYLTIYIVHNALNKFSGKLSSFIFKPSQYCLINEADMYYISSPDSRSDGHACMGIWPDIRSSMNIYCISSPGGTAKRRACTAVCSAIRRQTGMSNEAALKAARKCEFR